MPRTEIAVTEITRAGTTPPAEVTAVPADDHKWNNTGREFLQVRNNGAGAAVLTVVIPGSVDTVAVPDRDVSIPAAATRLFGPYPPATYNQTENGEPNAAYIDVPVGADFRIIIYRLS